jgi:hypothetical protein
MTSFKSRALCCDVVVIGEAEKRNPEWLKNILIRKEEGHKMTLEAVSASH